MPALLPAPKLTEKHLRNCRVVPDRLELLERLPSGGVVAEVGVLAGDFSRSILDIVRPTKLYLLDTYASDDWSWTGRFAAAEHLDFVRARFAAEISAGKVEIRRGLSWEELSKFDDGTFDWIYIDAGHDYDSVRQDLWSAERKVRPEGWIVMNDYIVYDPVLEAPYGVVHATNEFCLERGWEIVLLALQEHLFNDVALRRLR